jgi:hypothetical protein
MSRTIVRPWDYDRRPWLNETDRAVAALPLEWRMRYHEIFLLQPQPPTISQYNAYLQTLAEMEPDECRCCLPEQTCAACSQPATSDVVLPY